MSKTELDDLGESTDDLAQGFSKYASEIQALTGFNIMVEGSTTEFKDLYDILEGIAGVWDQLSDTQQARVAEILGGTRQLQVISSILGNWQDAAGAYADALDSANVATNANEIYMSTATAHLNQFKAAFQELSSTIVNSDLIAKIIDIGRVLLEVANSAIKFIDSFGGLRTLAPLILTIATALNKLPILTLLGSGAGKISSSISTITTGLNAFGLEVASVRKSGASLTQSLSAGFKYVGASISTAQLALGAFGLVLSAASIAFSAYEQKREKAIQQANEDAANSTQTVSELKDAYAEYIKLSSATDVTSDSQQRIGEILDGVTEKLGDQASVLSKLTRGTEAYNNKLKELINTSSKDALIDAEEAIEKQFSGLGSVKIQAKLKSDTARNAMDKYISDFAKSSGRNASYGVIGNNLFGGYTSYNALGGDNYAENMVVYYNQLNDTLEELYKKRKENGEFSKEEKKDFEEIKSILGELEDPINTYVGALYDVASTNYTLNNGTPETDAEKEEYKRKIAQDIAKSLGISEDDAAKITDDFIEADAYAKSIEKSMNKAMHDANEMEGSVRGAVANLNMDTSGLDTLKDIYEDIANGGDFNWDSILNSKDFSETFGDLGSVYEDFVETVLNNTDDITACQSAFDNLATAYLESSGALKDLTPATRDASIAMLEQKGIANAAAIVDYELAVQAQYAAYSTGELANASGEQIQAVLATLEPTSAAAEAVRRLAQAKFDASVTTIQTSADIQNCIALADAAANAANYVRLMKAAAGSGISGATVDVSVAQTKSFVSGVKSKVGAKVSTLSASGGNAKNTVSYSGGGGSSGGSGGGGGSSSTPEEKEETWFEKQYAEHQHLVNLEKEDQSTYLAWLEKAYKQAYNEGIIELDEYRKYAEEVFNGLRELFDDYINDIDHEIKMRSNYDGEKQKIISLYKEEIKAIEGEIAKARQYGLDDNDDYIQELQDKWQSAKDNLQEIYDDALDGAKDAVDDLVDYVEDMLKQDVEDQKDALDKKLDYLKEFYDKQKELLQDAYDEEEYLKDQAEKRKSVTDIQAALEQLAYDDSAWAQKRKLELQDELNKAQEELNQFEKDHALEEALDALEDAYNEQERQLQAQMDALSDVINDPEALYNKALSYIKDNTDKLYDEMVEYNRRHGTGNDEDIKDKYEEAYKSLLEYNEVNGSWYKGIKLENSTNVQPSNGSWNSQTVANPKPATNPNTSAPKTSNSNTSAPSPSPTTKTVDEATAKGVAAAIWCEGTRSGWGNGDDRKNKLTAKFGSAGQQKIQGLLNSASNGSLYNYWVSSLGQNASKYYYSKFYTGTSNAPYGFAKINELGDELIFSPRAGGQFKLLSGGEKIFNADATSFLYDFANGGGDILANIIGMAISKFSPALAGVSSTPVINMGDIIVNGNADMQTVSEIRRAQRANVEYMLKEFNKLNK